MWNLNTYRVLLIQSSILLQAYHYCWVKRESKPQGETLVPAYHAPPGMNFFCAA